MYSLLKYLYLVSVFKKFQNQFFENILIPKRSTYVKFI